MTIRSESTSWSPTSRTNNREPTSVYVTATETSLEQPSVATSRNVLLQEVIFELILNELFISLAWVIPAICSLNNYFFLESVTPFIDIHCILYRYSNLTHYFQ